MRMSFVVTALCILTCFNEISAVHDISKFGAVPSLGLKQPDVSVANKNAEAIQKAFQAANEDENGDRTVFVPNKSYYFTAIQLRAIKDVVFQIEGMLIAHNNISTWPTEENGHALDEFNIQDSSGLTITGNGSVDGQGYIWWWYSISCALPNVKHSDTRAHMFHFEQCYDIVIEGIKMINSPLYHLNLQDVHNVTVRNFEIFVDVFRQKALLQEFGFWDFNHSLPTFPLNTDGIDPSASGVHIYNGKITNFDDAVVFKPCRTTSMYCQECASGYVHDLAVNFSVGLSIGSVPPNSNVNCIKDVTFRDIKMDNPLKGIYIKSNPGTSGRGVVKNITFENIAMERAIWWPLWIGPQQMHQPDGNFLGCDMLYPYRPNSVCPTNPLVSITDITLRNVTSLRAFDTPWNPYPGMVLCDETTPCMGLRFEDVKFQRGQTNEDYAEAFVVAHAHGTSSSIIPDLVLEE